MPLPKHLKNKYNYLNTAPVNCMINSLFISRLNPVSVRQLYRLTLPIYNIFLEQKNELWRRCLPVRVVFIPLSDHMICVSTCTVLHIPNLYSCHLEILYLVDHVYTSMIRIYKVIGMHWNHRKKIQPSSQEDTVHETLQLTDCTFTMFIYLILRGVRKSGSEFEFPLLALDTVLDGRLDDVLVSNLQHITVILGTRLSDTCSKLK